MLLMLLILILRTDGKDIIPLTMLMQEPIIYLTLLSKGIIAIITLFSSHNNPNHVIAANSFTTRFPTTGQVSCTKHYLIDGKELILPRCSMIH